MPEPTPTPFPIAGKTLKNVQVTTEFGGSNFAMGNHTGIDIAVPAGSPVLAVEGGVITHAGWKDGGYGNVVIIKDPAGNSHLYEHLSAVVGALKPGTRIERGTHIGAVGSTGRSSGNHLHYEVQDPRGNPINPKPYLTGEARSVSTPTNAVDPLALATSARARYDELNAQLVAARALIARPTDSMTSGEVEQWRNLTKGNGLTELETAATNALKVWEIAVSAGAGKSLTPEQTNLLKAQADQATAQAEKLRKDAAQIGDPNDPQRKQMEAQAANLMAQAKETSALTGAKGALLGAQAQAAQASAVGNLASAEQARAQAASISRLVEPTIQKLAADAGLTNAQSEEIRRLLAPKIEQLSANTRLTGAQADQILQSLPDQIRAVQSGINLTDTQVQRITDLLPGEVRKQAVDAGLVEAQTGLTGAQAGLVGAQTEATAADTRLKTYQGDAEAARQSAWDRYVAPVLSAGGTPQQIQEAVGKAATSVKEFTDFLTTKIQQDNSQEVARANRAREVLTSDTNRISLQQTDEAARNNVEQNLTARTNARTNQQAAATGALEQYSRSGVASAPFMGNVLGSQAPLVGVEGLKRLAQSMGVGSGVLDGVLAGYQQYEASQAQLAGQSQPVRRAELQYAGAPAAGPAVAPAEQLAASTPGAPPPAAPPAGPPAGFAGALQSFTSGATEAAHAAAQGATPLVQALLRRRSGV